MKKLLLTTALTSLMALSASSFAADTSGAMSGMTDGLKNTTSEMKGHVAGKMMKDQMAADSARLNLTADQKTKIDKIVTESKKDLDEDIRDVLDSKQKVEFDKIQAEHKAAWSKTQ